MTDTTHPAKSQQPVTPITVTQRNSMAVLGIPGQQGPDRVRSEGIPHRRVGQLTIAKVEDVLRVLFTDSTGADPATSADPSERIRTALGLEKRGAR
jgi:hypothetical protein